MESTVNNCFEFAEALGLKPDADGLFIGKVDGFPIGLKLIEPQGACLFLFQIRHWLMEDASQLKSIRYTEHVNGLLAEKKIQIEFGDRLAWLTVIDADSCLVQGPISELLESVLASFQDAGLIGDPELCHYCQKERVSILSSSGGKVAQICPACLEERSDEKRRATASPAAEAVPIALMSPIAAFAGAILWAAFWTAHTMFFERTDSEVIYVPRLLMGVLMICVGLLVGGPVGWIIKQNRRRGSVVSATAAILFSSLAVLAGEFLFVVWLIYHQFQVVSLSAALQVMPEYFLHNDVMYLIFKGLAGFVSVAAAYEIAKPKQATLKL